MERTFTLLEKERAEKNELIRRVERLERDIEGYIWAVKDRDSKLTNLNTRLKQKDKEATDDSEKLKKEIAQIKQAYEENAKRLKCATIKSKSDTKFKPTISKTNKDNQSKQTVSPLLKSRRIMTTPLSAEVGQVSKIPIPRFYKSLCNIQPVTIPKAISIKALNVGT